MQQLVFPLQLGGEQVTSEIFDRMPRGEQEYIARLMRFSPGERFWEVYRGLRAQGYKTLDAIVGAWQATGAKGRGSLRTLKSLAEALGVNRHTVYRAKERTEKIVGGLVMSWLLERVPDVDEALYRAALSLDGTAADRKLFYQRARVSLSGEEAEPVDQWAQLLEQAREQSEEQEVEA